MNLTVEFVLQNPVTQLNFVEFRDGRNFEFFETIECRVTYDMITPWHGACVMSEDYMRIVS